MDKPSHPLEPGGAMTAVSMVVGLAIAPLTAIGVVAGLGLGTAAGALGLASSIGMGALLGGGIPLALGLAATAALIALPFVTYPFEMAKWKLHQKRGGGKAPSTNGRFRRGPGVSLKRTAQKLEGLKNSFLRAKNKPAQQDNGHDAQNKPPSPPKPD